MKTIAFLTILFSTAFLLRCDSEPSMASRSNEAYREAVARGENVAGGHEHGGHEAATGTTLAMNGGEHHTSGTGAGPDRAVSDPMPSGDAAGSSHGAMEHAAGEHSAPTVADHAAMGHTPAPASGARGEDAMPSPPADAAHGGHQMQPSATSSSAHAGHTAAQPAGSASAAPAAQPSAHAGHQPAPSAPAPGHEMHATDPRTEGPAAPAARTSETIASASPAATLDPDALDAPVEISVAEAEKAARASEGRPAGQGSEAPVASPAPAPMDHSGHPAPAPKKD